MNNEAPCFFHSKFCKPGFKTLNGPCENIDLIQPGFRAKGGCTGQFCRVSQVRGQVRWVCVKGGVWGST